AGEAAPYERDEQRRPREHPGRGVRGVGGGLLLTGRRGRLVRGLLRPGLGHLHGRRGVLGLLTALRRLLVPGDDLAVAVGLLRRDHHRARLRQRATADRELLVLTRLDRRLLRVGGPGDRARGLGELQVVLLGGLQ